ncbi:hypothetical protein OG625_09855 [Streptomyces sp. NBC_01351]|uniref:hypothetical protein n=1 Tax=Streptomyces sp. NBC_01351 TaxID=2903833 RepID=UPI002E324D2B|nr:hypothetical protein [Streptomyces sp. NBC_01351]
MSSDQRRRRIPADPQGARTLYRSESMLTGGSRQVQGTRALVLFLESPSHPDDGGLLEFHPGHPDLDDGPAPEDADAPDGHHQRRRAERPAS